MCDSVSAVCHYRKSFGDYFGVFPVQDSSYEGCYWSALSDGQFGFVPDDVTGGFTSEHGPIQLKPPENITAPPGATSTGNQARSQSPLPPGYHPSPGYQANVHVPTQGMQAPQGTQGLVYVPTGNHTHVAPAPVAGYTHPTPGYTPQGTQIPGYATYQSIAGSDRAAAPAYTRYPTQGYTQGYPTHHTDMSNPHRYSQTVGIY